MASGGERFLKGLLASGRGISGAYVQSLIDWEKRKKAEEEERRQSRRDALYQQNVESLITEREEPKPEKEPTGGDFQILETDQGLIRVNKLTGESSPLESGGKALVKPKTAKEKERPEDMTGIGEFEDVVSRRRKEAEDKRKTYLDSLQARMPFGVTLKAKSPEDALIEIKNMAGVLKPGDAAPFLNLLQEAGQPPGTYDIPREQDAVALAESTEVARTDPAMAAAIMDVQGEDPEIAKARKAYESGQIDKKTFEEFVEKYNASLVR